MNNNKTLVVGNSHINSFRRSFGKALKQNDLSIDADYVMTNLLKTPWGDFEQNSYLRYLQYEDELAPAIDLRQRKIRPDLVLVGMGLLGGGIALPYGGVRNVPGNDKDNAGKYTARFPGLPGADAAMLPVHSTETIAVEKAADIYRDFYDRKFAKIRQLIRKGRYKSMCWIAEPDMVEGAGSKRFGQDFVDSGLYDRHRRLARQVVVELIEKYGFQDNIILHPEDHNRTSGFTDDRFRASIVPYDVHVSPDYFDDCCQVLVERLQQPAGMIETWLSSIKIFSGIRRG